MRYAALLLAAALLTGCSSGSPPSGEPAPSSAAPEYDTYVALGDSFSAGPLIPTSDLASGCLRSDHNYPSLVARRLDVSELVDVTCSGAATADLTDAQTPLPETRIPPQLDAVDAGTDLVTLGIGGNDLGLFATVVRTCTSLRGSDPDGAPCTTALQRRGLDVAAAARTIGRRVATGLAAVQQKAPQARVLLVGYPRLVPEQGTCPELPLAAGDYATARRLGRVLDRALAAAARRAGVDYVDLYAASAGHDICADEPWVNGKVTDRQRALAYHPFARGMQAAATEVLATLGDR